MIQTKKKALPFYKSAAWKKARETVLLRDHYLCQFCFMGNKIVQADIVHHIEHLSERPDKALDADNLISVCAKCHNRLHPEKGKRGGGNDQVKEIKARVIETKANEEYY
ncbi:HNH endonuclease [Hazenella sp. IB182357]|uniref:Putative HNH nuclease YajD n=1 Tax=Polycladospora coralii TaxID=2771432 RepID=A0A926RYQ2_9BACL|nr:HNH endonuclease signature motif containing protein [Polycladospora coralii]MBD1373726.1 HNH endonuclease [Polycladospora coralii]